VIESLPLAAFSALFPRSIDMKFIIALLVLCTFAPVFAVGGLSGFDDKAFTRPTLVAVACETAPVYKEKIFEDKDYFFVVRNSAKRGSVPGLFVHAAKGDRWIEIKKLSTENAKLGRSAESQGSTVNASWDFAELRKQLYVSIPLRTTGDDLLPDKISFDEKSLLYRLEFNSALKQEVSLTDFYITRTDLEEAFDDAAD
jgi:hypothetical protein